MTPIEKIRRHMFGESGAYRMSVYLNVNPVSYYAMEKRFLKGSEVKDFAKRIFPGDSDMRAKLEAFLLDLGPFDLTQLPNDTLRLKISGDYRAGTVKGNGIGTVFADDFQIPAEHLDVWRELIAASKKLKNLREWSLGVPDGFHSQVAAYELRILELYSSNEPLQTFYDEWIHRQYLLTHFGKRYQTHMVYVNKIRSTRGKPQLFKNPPRNLKLKSKIFTDVRIPAYDFEPLRVAVLPRVIYLLLELDVFVLVSFGLRQITVDRGLSLEEQVKLFD